MNNEPVAWMSEFGQFIGKVQDEICHIPLYTHPVKELNNGGELVKNATYWKRQHDNLLMKLNTCAVKLSELEKQLDTRTRELIGASFYEHDYKTMMADSEPVGLFRKTDWGWEHFLPTSNDHNGIPLYTHPVKELTDEEIDELVHEYNCIDDYPHEFVRACIRKAQSI